MLLPSSYWGLTPNLLLWTDPNSSSTHGAVTTTVRRTLTFANTNVFTLKNYRQQTRNNQTLRTVTTTIDAAGTHVDTVDEQDPLTAVEMFQQPPRKDSFTLPAHVTQSKIINETMTSNNATTFSSSLNNSVQGAGVLSEYNGGQYRLANGTDQQNYAYRDSTGLVLRAQDPRRAGLRQDGPGELDLLRLRMRAPRSRCRRSVFAVRGTKQAATCPQD